MGLSQEVERVSGGKRVLRCPNCRDAILDDQQAQLQRSDSGGLVLTHAGCIPPKDDPEKLVHYFGGEA